MERPRPGDRLDRKWCSLKLSQYVWLTQPACDTDNRPLSREKVRAIAPLEYSTHCGHSATEYCVRSRTRRRRAERGEMSPYARIPSMRSLYHCGWWNPGSICVFCVFDLRGPHRRRDLPHCSLLSEGRKNTKLRCTKVALVSARRISFDDKQSYHRVHGDRECTHGDEPRVCQPHLQRTYHAGISRILASTSAGTTDSTRRWHDLQGTS